MDAVRRSEVVPWNVEKQRGQAINIAAGVEGGKKADPSPPRRLAMTKPVVLSDKPERLAVTNLERL